MVSLQLFDFLANCIYEFMKVHDLLHRTLPLGNAASETSIFTHSLLFFSFSYS